MSTRKGEQPRLPDTPQPDDRTVPRPPGDTLLFLQHLWALDHALMTRSKLMEKELGVTGQQRLVVRLIGHAGMMSPGTLSAMLHFHPSTVTGIVKRLEAKGLIRRAADPHDGRRMLLSLAPEGQKINRNRSGTAEEAVGKVLRATEAGDVETAMRLLGRMVAELQKAERL